MDVGKSLGRLLIVLVCFAGQPAFGAGLMTHVGGDSAPLMFGSYMLESGMQAGAVIDPPAPMQPHCSECGLDANI